MLAVISSIAPMPRRREFLARATGALGALVLSPAAAAAGPPEGPAPDESLEALLSAHPSAADPARLAEDEPFWARLRARFDLEPGIVNLDHGWTNPPPRAAMDILVRDARAIERLPADRLPRYWETISSTKVRAALAEAMGVAATEIALVRNATEALDTVLLGLPMQPGDEIVCSAHDYYAMLDALEQRRARDGVVLRMLRPPLPAPSLDALAAMYEEAIGPRTRLVLLTHPSNLTGQLLPVRRIAAAAHRVGAEVVVDGAQSLGLLDDPVRSLDCDYYGASAHKWLGTPVGLGVLWMRPAHVAKVWPLLPPAPGTKGMARFEWIGTAPEYVNPAALPALAVQRTLGAARKRERLRFLAASWRSRVAARIPDARFYASDAADMSLGLTLVEWPGIDALAVQKRLFDRDRILVQGMSGNMRAPEIRGVRVTPNVYTSPAELDRLVTALVAAHRGRAS